LGKEEEQQAYEKYIIENVDKLFLGAYAVAFN